MGKDQDPDIFVAEVYILRDELGHRGEMISEERLTDIVLEGLTDEYDLIKFNLERYPDFIFDEIEVTMFNMYANRVARGT